MSFSVWQPDCCHQDDWHKKRRKRRKHDCDCGQRDDCDCRPDHDCDCGKPKHHPWMQKHDCDCHDKCTCGKKDKRKKDTILGTTVDVGETVAIVIEGNGVNGVFTGRVAFIGHDVVRLVLTASVGTIPAGTVITIDRDEVAAVARVPETVGITA